jgi:hypothetical protein
MADVDEATGHQWDDERKQCACGWKSKHGHEISHLHVESPKFEARPHIWIQWKGTDVCCDIHCRCGAHLHFDGDFMYFLRCPHCRTVWEVGTHVALYEVKDHRADGAFIKEAEADEEPEAP